MTGELGKLKTHSPIYWKKYNCENSLNLRHTLGSIFVYVNIPIEILVQTRHYDNKMNIL